MLNDDNLRLVFYCYIVGVCVSEREREERFLFSSVYTVYIINVVILLLRSNT